MDVRLIDAVPSAAIALALAGCSSPPEWTTQQSPSGLFTIEVPGNPDVQQQDVPLATGQVARARISVVEVGDDAYFYSETTLPSGTTFDLDAGIEGSVDNMLASIESQLDTSGSATIDAIETTEFDGNEARQYSGSMDVGDTTFTFGGAMYIDGDVLAQVMAFDRGGDNTEEVDRFLDSMESTNT